jgi:hypothetical protein
MDRGLKRSRLLELVKPRASLLDGWSRLAIALRAVPGAFQIGERPDRTAGGE